MNKFEDMKTYIRIVEAGSITLAADQMNTAKSAISKRLSNLENSLGVTLLQRTTRSQTLTENGKIYYKQCLRIIDEVNEMEASLQNTSLALSGNIKISVPLSFGLEHMAPALNEFINNHKGIKMDIDFNDRKVDIVNEGFDFAIRIGELPDSSLIAKKISHVRTLLVASPGYLKTHGTPKTPDELSTKHKSLSYRNSPGSLNFMREDGSSYSLRISDSLISNNGDFLCQAALQDMGILNSPDFICYEHVKSGELLPILTDCYKPSAFGVYAIYPQTRYMSGRVRALIDFLSQHFGEVPYWSV